MIHFDQLELMTRVGLVQIPKLNAGQSVACVGAAGALCRSILQPELITNGSIKIEGRSCKQALRDGQLSYAPLYLPLRPEERLGAVLRSLHRQAGGKKEHVDEIFEHWGQGYLLKRRGKELHPLEQRKAAWVFALIRQPQVLIFEDPFEELSELEGAEFYQFARPILDNQPWLGALSGFSPPSRDFMRAAQQILQVKSGKTATLSPVADWQNGTYWLILSEHDEAKRVFTHAEFDRASELAPGRYLIDKKDLQPAIDLCTENKILIQSYFPADESP